MAYTPERMREYRRLWIAARRREFFADKACARCGGTDRLELHHIDPAQKLSSRIWSWAKARREAEIRKCMVLCRLCHEKHHAAERRAAIPHGTINAYDTLSCRCESCRAANSTYRQELRQRATANG